MRYLSGAESMWSRSLVKQCDAGSEEVYRVLAADDPWAANHLVEVTYTGGIASVQRHSFSLTPPPPPPPPGSGRLSPSAIASEQTIDLPITVALSQAKLEEIREKARLLRREHLPLARGELALDGTGMVLEICTAGHYGFYSRENPERDNSQDLPVLELGDLILAAGGYPPF